MNVHNAVALFMQFLVRCVAVALCIPFYRYAPVKSTRPFVMSHDHTAVHALCTHCERLWQGGEGTHAVPSYAHV
jgi:hypothetical protein